jgi:hypothetical protein
MDGVSRQRMFLRMRCDARGRLWVMESVFFPGGAEGEEETFFFLPSDQRSPA